MIKMETLCMTPQIVRSAVMKINKTAKPMQKEKDKTKNVFQSNDNQAQRGLFNHHPAMAVEGRQGLYILYVL